ncbi:MAG TPA: hypothetical protein VHK63_04520 [Candidatus Limnocylindria bacterium]|nr:hypothetical protein [Candidatus Limnocylindria bacterium]
MAPPARARALILALLLGTAGAWLLPEPVAAIRDLPDEGAVVLGGDANFGAMVGDVDADGVRELVRLVAWEANPVYLALEVVSMADGGPRSHGQERVLRAASPDDTFAGRNPRGEDLLPLTNREPARLIAWHGGRTERVLLASIGTTGLSRPCCLTLWWVDLDRDGRTRLTLIGDTALSAAWVMAADMDADGFDELVVVETPNRAEPGTGVLVLRWNGADFERRPASVRPGTVSGEVTVLGDTDGRPGAEVGLVTRTSSGSVLQRVIQRGRRVIVEQAPLPGPGAVVGLHARDGARLVLVDGNELTALRWPRGGRASVTARTLMGGVQPGVLPLGSQELVVLLNTGRLIAFDSRLELQLSVAPGARALPFVASQWRPHVGELPGGDETGGKAYVVGGILLGGKGGPFGGITRDVALLPGRAPLGLFGPGLRWAAVGSDSIPPNGRLGGELRAMPGGQNTQVAVVPTEWLLRAEADEGRLQPEIQDAAGQASRGGTPLIFTRGDAVARFEAPAGSQVQVTGPQTQPIEYVVPANGLANVPLVPPAGRDAVATDQHYTARLLVVTPGGHGYAAFFEMRVERTPPELSASAPLASLSFGVTLAGRTEPGVRLAVEGEPVEVAADGTFRAEVDAGLVPRTVRLEATDVVGNRSELSLSVVGLVDYRRLPWVPIVAGLTLAIGLVLYLRVPRPAARSAGGPDEGSLEEIG